MSSKLEQALARLEHAVTQLEQAPFVRGLGESDGGGDGGGDDAAHAEIIAIRGLVDEAMSLIAAQNSAIQDSTKEDAS